MSTSNFSQTMHLGDGSIALTCRDGITTLSTYPNILDRRRFIAEARRFLDAMETLLDVESKLIDPQEAELRQAEIVWLEREAEVEQARRYG